MANTMSPKPTPPGPAGSAAATVRTRGGLNLVEYLKGVREELKKAQWPTRAELIRLTQVVLAVIFITAVYVGALDGALGWMTGRFLGFGK